MVMVEKEVARKRKKTIITTALTTNYNSNKNKK
jgi:hypothetical protein